MNISRREFGKLAAALPFASLAAIDRPNSLVNGVQLGVITYSYRQMPDTSAKALLGYIVSNGISATELMGEPAEEFAGAPSSRRGRGRTPGAREALRKWRTGASMDKYRELRKMYEDAGVKIYALKISPTPDMTDDEMDYAFNAGAAVGAASLTLEVTDDMAFLKRVGGFAEKHKVYAAYHSHEQGGMQAFDAAFAASKANMANVDFGHYVAGGNKGGDALAFLQKFHGRIASFHMKDRTTPEHGAKNLPWGEGDTPLTPLLQMVRKNKWKMPATIELEYPIPQGSDAVKEVAKCFDYCKKALA
jgi:sugar phosphate isomerase/epimerase